MSSKCLTYPSVSCPPSVPHFQVSHTSKCLTLPSVSHIQVSHALEYLFIQCLTYPSAYSFSVAHIRSPIHLVYHAYSFKRIASPSAYSFSVSHNQAYLFSVSCLRVPTHSSVFAWPCVSHPSVPHPSVSHIHVSHIQASHISVCPTPSSAYSFKRLQVPIHSSASKCLFIQCHAPRVSHTFGRHSYSYSCLFIRCLTFPSVCSFGVSHTHAYSFGVSHSQAPHIIVCIHSVAIHSVLRALDCLFIQCLMP
jgi:hypothetical protein